ncbi:MAG: TauD/TfdA family dioxygenase [Alphaproteobacteria bacterium]
MSWEAETVLPNDGIFELDRACLAELQAAAALIEANPLPVEALLPDDFPLPHCRALMATVKQNLEHGTGFAIIDRMPLDDFEPAMAINLHWLLMSLCGRIVAQKWDGTMVYDVTDTGRRPAAGNGVRSSKSNEGQGYHTDNAFGLPPDYVTLMCLQPAMAGGISGLATFDSIHNRMLDRHGDVLARLYQPFYYDRQREHAPDDSLISTGSIFEFDGETLRATLATDLNRQGYELAGEDMGDEARAALAAIDAVRQEPSLGKVFSFERGQIQLVNNRRIGHRRTAYTDSPDPALKRHLIRIWLRNHGRPFYHG